MNWIAVILLLLGMYLAAQRNIWTWPVTILGSAILIIYFCKLGDWPLVIFNIFAIAISIHGWKEWYNGRN